MRKLLSTIAALVALTGIAHAESCTVADPNATPLNVRASPNGKILGALNNGTSVTVTDRRGEWVRVAPLDGKSGWVWREYLRCPARAEGEKEYLEGIRDYWKGICWHARPYADDDDGAIFWMRGFNHALRLDRDRADRSHCRPGVGGKTAADVLVVVLADKNGETSMHYQKGVPHEDCMRLLSGWRKAMREEQPMSLEFEAPPDRLGITKGLVVEVKCVRPDGTIEGGR